MRLGPVEITRSHKTSELSSAADSKYQTFGSLEEALVGHQIVEVTPHAILVTPMPENINRQLTDPQSMMSELGSSGTTVYAGWGPGEYNAKLRDLQGMRVYNEMRRSDAQIKTALRLVKTPVLAAHWYMEAASEGKTDTRIRDFIWKNLTKQLTQSWPQLLTEILYHLDFGWYALEKVVADELVDGRRAWRKFAPRHPLECMGWQYDANGGPNEAIFMGPNNTEVPIPISKLLVFTNEREANNMTGTSVMRPMYKHWFIKDQMYKIDAIQKERHGIGIPMITLPPGYSEPDKKAADELGRNLRTNERAHIVVPPFWVIAFVKLEGQPVNVVESIDHHNMMILDAVLGGFMRKTGDSPELVQLYLKNTRFIAEEVRDVFNKWAIPELTAWNWGSNAEPPELKVRRIGETTDWRTLSFAIRNLIGAGALRVDIPLLEWIREELDLPKEDQQSLLQSLEPARAQGVVPVVPGKDGEQPAQPTLPAVGLPRQTPAKPSNGAGSGRVGRDGSGG